MTREKAGNATDATALAALELTVGALLDYLEAGERVLEVCCGDGRAAVACAERKNIRILGLDPLPERIEAALQNRVKARLRLAGTVKFEAGDPVTLEYCREIFDKVLASGALERLDRETLARALPEWTRVLKVGGLLLVSAPSAEGLANLNRLRAEFGLDPLSPPAEEVAPPDPESLPPELELAETREFMSTYAAAVSVFKPLLAASPGLAQAVPRSGEFERFAASLPSWGDYGPRRLLVYRKIAPSPKAA